MRMLVRAAAFCLMVGTTSAAWAQVGVLVGANFSSLQVSEQDMPELDRRTGLVAGMFVNLPSGPYFSVQPEVLYSQKGGEFQDGPAKATIELDYLDVPLLVRVTGGNRSGLVFLAGPSFGFKLRARARAEMEGETAEEDIGEDVESFDLGMIVGAGIASANFMVDGRYQWGLSNANKSDPEGGEVKNRVISVVFGIRF